MSKIEEIRRRAESDAKSRGYYLNPDPEFLKDLLKGLKKNEERFGYPSCPCRLASGNFELDRDIICPCDYRDIDVEEYGCCYCSLYVKKEIFEGKKSTTPIPERRPKDKIEMTQKKRKKNPSNEFKNSAVTDSNNFKPKKNLWYCKQCGYVVFREDPPYICPICKAKREMFTRIKIDIY